MTSKTKIVLGVFLGLIIAGAVIFYIVPATAESISFAHQKAVYDQSAEGIDNPMVAVDGKAISRSDPCAFNTTAQGLANCRANVAAAGARNAQILASNNELYTSIPQHENPLVTPKDNYRILSAEANSERYLSQMDCERLQQQVDWKIPSSYENNQSFTIVMEEVKQIYNSALIQCNDKIGGQN